VVLHDSGRSPPCPYSSLFFPRVPKTPLAASFGVARVLFLSLSSCSLIGEASPYFPDVVSFPAFSCNYGRKDLSLLRISLAFFRAGICWSLPPPSQGYLSLQTSVSRILFFFPGPAFRTGAFFLFSLRFSVGAPYLWLG